MALTWVTRPGSNVPDDPELLKSIDSKQKEFSTIDSMSDEECCRVCGATGDLSLEHTPAKAAFNKTSFLALSMRHPLEAFVQWQGRKVQGGSKDKTLCKTCNNNTGSWYNAEYVKFARKCAFHAKPENAGKSITLSLKAYPNRLIKQALTNICSVSQPGLCKRHRTLKELIQQKEMVASISPLKVGVFINVNNVGRSSGVTVFVDNNRKIARLIAEFSFWPLGWILTFDDISYPGILDVSEWTNIDNGEKRQLTLEMPCQWVAGPYPGDFRSPEQLAPGGSKSVK
ncbi:MAG: hypothetical protein KAI70_01675 [Candidatus Omnitrophica bacterium]|nr:hypothetical protein [Candidatus Omnitrophota bacterium]